VNSTQLLQRFIEHVRKSDTRSAQLQRDIGFGLIHIGSVNMLCPPVDSGGSP
jgi:hypothetical protein